MKKLFKKNYLLFSLLLVFILSIMQFNIVKVYASTSSDFTIDSKGVLVKYNGPGGAVVIPDGVTSIGDFAFSNNNHSYSQPVYNTSLTSVTIPSSVKSIGSSAFEYCTNLKSISIPSSVISIGNSAFYGCSSLASITLPSSVRSIENYAFEKCTSLTSINIPNGVMNIGIEEFGQCTSLTSITIPNTVRVIEECAFDGDTSLNNITIPNSVVSIEGGAFVNCTNLTNITIPDSVDTIHDGAFENCTNLKSVTISSGVTSINVGAFSGTNVTINGKSKSFAEAYALNNKIPFVSSGVVSSSDQLYTIAYNAVWLLHNQNTQKDINIARVAIDNLKNTAASWAIGQFSQQTDLVQQPILVKAITAITAAQNNPSQARVNFAKAAIDPNLPQIWKNSYSSAVDVVEQTLMKKAVDATNKAIQSKLQVDIDAANLIISDIKTSTDPSISAWADTLKTQLSNIK